MRERLKAKERQEEFRIKKLIIKKMQNEGKDGGPSDLRRHFAPLRYDGGFAYDGRPVAL